jgi:glyoxylase I family protein
MKLDHVTIRTRDLPAARSFFLSIFDLKEGERPLAIHRIPGPWLYSEAIRWSTSSARKDTA